MIEPPPSIHPLLEGQPYNADLKWIIFFNDLYNGDIGTTWTPTFVNLSQTGTATITGRYYQVSQYLTFFNIQIVPATDTSSTAASTYCNNFPLRFSSNSICLASTGTGAVQAVGGINSSDNGIYTPTWTSLSSTINVIGFGEAS